MSNYPNWYMTVDEFAALVADTVYECGYFKRGDRVHPEDIEAAFTATATAVAKGAAFVGNKAGWTKAAVSIKTDNPTNTGKIDSNINYYVTNNSVNESQDSKWFVTQRQQIPVKGKIGDV